MTRTVLFGAEGVQGGGFSVRALEVRGDAGVEFGGAQVEFGGGGVFADEGRDFLHFRDPAIGFGMHFGHLFRQPAVQRGLALREFGFQRVGGARARGGEHHTGAKRGEALGDAGIGHLHRRGGADRSGLNRHGQSILFQYRGLGCVGSGQIDLRRFGARRGRSADDAAIDEGRTGFLDDTGNP